MIGGERYQGPREFSSAQPQELQSDLQRLASEVARVLGLSQAGLFPRWNPGAQVFRANCSVDYGQCVEVDTFSGLTVNVRLPKPDTTKGFLGIAILRRSNSGTVNVVPSFGAKIEAGASGALITLPATTGVYVYWFDGADWWRQRG